MRTHLLRSMGHLEVDRVRQSIRVRVGGGVRHVVEVGGGCGKEDQVRRKVGRWRPRLDRRAVYPAEGHLPPGRDKAAAHEDKSTRPPLSRNRRVTSYQILGSGLDSDPTNFRG